MLRSFFILVLIVSAGCSNKLPPAGVAAYQACDYQKAKQIFETSEKKKKDALLYDLAILSAAVHSGDVEEVKKAGLRAQQQMWGYEGDAAGTASLISSEAIRFYKGEPFEKTMASMYLGIVYFNEQDYDNARAAFTKAVFAVQTKNEDIPPDFAAPHVFLAKTYLKLNDEDNARITLERLAKALPKYRLTVEDLRKTKTIAFVEFGVGPKKIRTGPGGSLIGWQRQNYSVDKVRLGIDGKPLDVMAHVSDDLTYQAQSVDRKGKTAIQATKGVLREAAGVTSVIAANEAIVNRNATAGWVALGTGLFALANQSQADVRQWELLPDQILLALSDDPESPGNHEYSAHFYGRGQNELPSLRRVWYDNRKSDQDKVYIINAKACQNPVK